MANTFCRIAKLAGPSLSDEAGRRFFLELYTKVKPSSDYVYPAASAVGNLINNNTVCVSLDAIYQH